jgi:hypothetical protein
VKRQHLPLCWPEPIAEPLDDSGGAIVQTSRESMLAFSREERIQKRITQVLSWATILPHIIPSLVKSGDNINQ